MNKHQENSSKMFIKINDRMDLNSTKIYDCQKSVEKMTENVSTSLKGFRDNFEKINK